jgi:hypothetical protein
MSAADAPKDPKAALKRMTFFATVLTLAGHTFLGFEQSWAQVAAALLTAYALEALLEFLDSRATDRTPRYLGGGIRRFLEFFLSPHLTGLSVALLLMTHDRLLPIIFGVVVGIGAKWLIKTPASAGGRHIFNPSNLGICLALLLFATIGIAPPYHFTEGVSGWLDWVVPGVILCIGFFLNYKLTRRIPLIMAWLGGFAAQAVLRSLLFGTPPVAGLMPFTGMAFMLYTLYMITDPATTPSDRRGQIGFGLAVAGVYGVLMVLHIVYGLFFALMTVCAVRGLSIHFRAWRVRAGAPALAPAASTGE